MIVEYKRISAGTLDSLFKQTIIWLTDGKSGFFHLRMRLWFVMLPILMFTALWGCSAKPGHIKEAETAKQVGLAAEEAAGRLALDGYEAPDIADALVQAYQSTPDEVAKAFTALQYQAGDIADLLINNLELAPAPPSKAC